ncbi:hypothetical protein [Mycobacterium sherrisii]|uniref:hypothetical protein n=1 Tax=Mycobacterium sherrisii TaxID=243061 RepID=UPI000AA7E458|nr:hypothetical protein [Mycobacterium sherrisii]
MSAKHRMPVSRKRDRAAVCAAAPLSLLCAAGFTALTIAGWPAEKPSTSDRATAAAPSESATNPVSQEGVLIAVTPDSVTARSVGGFTRTYFFTPDTTVITQDGSQHVTATSPFTINEDVDIVGTVRGGKAFATSLASRNLGHGDGPPMDGIAAP